MVRTRRVVTAVTGGSAGSSDVPANSQVSFSELQRSVIVTAAVHRGFGSSLAALPLTFRHWAGVSPHTAPCGFAETCVFGKQSPGPAHCGPQPARRARRVTGTGTPSPEVTGRDCRVP